MGEFWHFFVVTSLLGDILNRRCYKQVSLYVFAFNVSHVTDLSSLEDFSYKILFLTLFFNCNEN
jgi:hypothetical protein